MSSLVPSECPRFESLQEAASRVPGLNQKGSELFLTFLRAAAAVQRTEASLLAQNRLSQGRLVVLLLLKNAGEAGLKSSELALSAGVTKATITGLLDSLERDGWVMRFSDPADRRSVSARITGPGLEVIEGLIPSYFEAVTRALSSLSPAEQDQLSILLSKVHRAFRSPLHHE